MHSNYTIQVDRHYHVKYSSIIITITITIAIAITAITTTVLTLPGPESTLRYNAILCQQNYNLSYSYAT